MKTTRPGCILLDPDDNVAVVIQENLPKGEYSVGDVRLLIQQNTPFGHKVALRDIPASAAIVKCGVSIGTATIAIAAGEHVHLHNMKSNYIPTYIP